MLDKMNKYKIKIEKESDLTKIVFRNGLSYEVRKDDVTINIPDNNYDYDRSIIITSNNFFNFDWTVTTNSDNVIRVFAHTKSGDENELSLYKMKIPEIIPTGLSVDIKEIIRIFGFIIREVKLEIKKFNPTKKDEVGF